MGVYDRPIATAKRLIEKYGATCVWNKPAAIVEDVPGYPTEGAVPDPVSCKIAFFRPKDVGQGSEMFLALMAGIEVPQSDEIGLLAGDITFTPEMTDTITRGSETLSIDKLDVIRPDGVTAVLWYVGVNA